MKYYIHDGAAQLRFEIEGSLSGNAATELEQSWCTASSVIGNRSFLIVLGDVTGIDLGACALLRRWSAAGARFAARSALTAELVASIIGQPVVCIPRVGRDSSRTWALAQRALIVIILSLPPFLLIISSVK